MHRFLFFIVSVFFITAFSSSAEARDPCPKIYQPVCALTTDGTTKTFGNFCEAKHATIISQGQCPTKPKPAAACPKNYAPICGLSPVGNEKTYSNMCELRNQEGDAIYKGACTTKATSTQCPRNFAPVCGSKARVQKTYSNDCYRKKAGANFVSQGACR